jgi:tripartite-type tricarboxylate transporter receptor subunit TctC
MKQWITGLAAAVTITVGVGVGVGAQAQTPSYPTKPIRMVVPYAAGGGLDAIARLVAQGMSEGLGQTIVVENKAGAGGTIGADSVAKAVPDGYTLLMAGNPEPVINPTLMTGVRYNVARDFVPVMLVAESPNIIVSNASFKEGLREIMEGRFQGPGAITVGTPGQGSPQHIAVEVLRSLGKTDLVHVPYKGAGPAVVDVLGGQIRLAITGSPPLLAHIKSGKLKALAVTQSKRSSLIPNVPTFEEATGMKGLETYSTWYGLLAPTGTPAAVVEVLRKSIAAVLAKPELIAKINAMGSDVVALPTSAFSERMNAELKRYEEVIRRFNVKVE